MTACSSLLAVPRALVSQNKRRFQEAGYDLDLCYVHPRVIVMCFPAVGIDGLFRNPRAEIVRLLEERHAGHYHVYNFCDERKRQYPKSVFDGRASCFPIEDHNVPTLHQMVTFCESAASWLQADEKNVVALHCKAGKGRAGMMCCMLLQRMGFVSSAADAIEQYNRMRVRDMRGLTVTSQKKWVQYYEKLLHRQRLSPPPVTALSIVEPTLVLKELLLQNTLTAVTPPRLRLRVYQLDRDIATKKLVHQAFGYEQFSLNEPVCGSVLLEFRTPKCGACLHTKHLKVWFNTLLLTPDPKTGHVIFPRSDMDWVSRDRKLRRFPAAMELEMHVVPQ